MLVLRHDPCDLGAHAIPEGAKFQMRPVYWMDTEESDLRKLCRNDTDGWKRFVGVKQLEEAELGDGHLCSDSKQERARVCGSADFEALGRTGTKSDIEPQTLEMPTGADRELHAG